MRIRLIASFLSLLTLVSVFQKPVYSIPTKWEDANISINALLDSGWQITSHGFNRVAANSTTVSSGFDEKVFTFLLTNGRKHIICLSDNPKPPSANASSCRKLNCALYKIQNHQLLMLVAENQIRCG